MERTIIPQYYERYNSFDDLLDGKATQINFLGSAKKINPREILDFEKIFIIAEPGHGKTTVVDQILSILKQDKIPFHYVNGINNEIMLLDSYKASTYLIFDALDENKDVIATFIKVQNFCKENNIKLIITNRTHYLSLIKHLLIDDNFNFIRLLPFNDQQIFTFLELKLKKLNYQDVDFTEIIKRSKVSSRVSILSVPRYLNEFCKYILQNNIAALEIKQLSKADLFEKIIYYKLETDDNAKGSNSNQKYLTKRVLERLSLVMEIHGLNQITKEDFITFLDQTDSNISLIFLNSIDLDVLLSRVMKTTGDILQFENSEFQEFMAAKELVRLGYRYQIIYDLMIDPQLQLLLPNWIDVLRFAIDLEPEFVRPIVTFVRSKNHETIDEKLIQMLIDVPHEHFDEKFLNFFFDTIFDYYTAKGKFIYSISESLTRFLTESNKTFFYPIYKIDELKDAVRHVQSNQILIIEALAKSNRLNDIQVSVWVEYLIELSQIDELYSIQMSIFYGLIALGKPKPLLALISVFEKKSDYLLNNYLSALTKMIPNDIKVIDLINRIINEGRKIDCLEMAINNVSAAEGIISLFKNLTHLRTNLRIDPFGYGSGFYTLFKCIEKINSQKVNESIQQFLLVKLNEDQYRYDLPKICKESLIYLVRKKPIFLKKIISLNIFINLVDDIAKLLARHIELKTFKWIERFLVHNNHEWRLERMISLTKMELEYDKDNPIYKYIDVKYHKKSVRSAISYENPVQKTNLEQLREYYLEDRNYFHPHLIPFFVNNYDELENQLLDNDLKEINDVVSMILKAYNPDNFRLTINEVKGNHTSFSHNQETWFHIELYFKTAYLLGEKQLIKKYRKKLLKTLPLIDVFEHQREGLLDNLVHTISPITDQDVLIIHDFCMKRTDDLLALSSRSFVEMAKKLGLHQLNPVLLMLVENPKVQYYEKEESLRAFGFLATGKNDFETLKNITKSGRFTKKLIDIANAALITNYQDEDAIKWRFKELKTRMQPFDMDHKYNGARAVGVFEIEMDRPEFPKCLYGVENSTIYNEMLDLLTFSFSIRNNILQFRYSNYLQQIVYNYFKTFLNRQVLSDLKKTISKFSFVDQTYSFNTQIDELIKDLQNQGKNQEPFITAIHGLNIILKKVYLPINSNEELRELILKVINTDIKSLIEDEGFYRVADELKEKENQPSIKVGEVIIQKTLKIALEKALLDNGLRKSDIFREVESLDGLRYDYLISYGLYGPIMVELKLLHNDEIQNDKKRKEYKVKMLRYLGANQGQGIYSVFQIHNKPNQFEQYQKLLEEYKDVRNLDIPLLKCYDV